MVDKRVRIVDGELQFPSNFFVVHSVRVSSAILVVYDRSTDRVVVAVELRRVDIVPMWLYAAEILSPA